MLQRCTCFNLKRFTYLLYNASVWGGSQSGDSWLKRRLAKTSCYSQWISGKICRKHKTGMGSFWTVSQESKYGAGNWYHQFPLTPFLKTLQMNAHFHLKMMQLERNSNCWANFWWQKIRQKYSICVYFMFSFEEGYSVLIALCFSNLSSNKWPLSHMQIWSQKLQCAIKIKPVVSV